MSGPASVCLLTNGIINVYPKKVSGVYPVDRVYTGSSFRSPFQLQIRLWIFYLFSSIGPFRHPFLLGNLPEVSERLVVETCVRPVGVTPVSE